MYVSPGMLGGTATDGTTVQGLAASQPAATVAAAVQPMPARAAANPSGIHLAEFRLHYLQTGPAA